MKSVSTVGKEKNLTIQALRGIAAISVLLFHYSINSYVPLAHNNTLKKLFSFGYLGVECFFVISGFVIPLSLYKSNFEVKKIPIFLVKRFIRIDLPYYAAILCLLLLIYTPILFLNRPLNDVDYSRYTLSSLGYHLFTAVNFSDYKWYDPAYWTLAIEFQFYFIMAFTYPVLVNVNKIRWQFLSFIALLLATYYLPIDNIHFFKYNSLFVLGIIGFCYYESLVERNTLIIAALITSIIGLIQLPIIAFSAGIVTLLCILTIKIKNKILLFLGSISYSIYITHIITAYALSMLINQIIDVPETLIQKTCLFLFFVAVEIFTAYLFHKIVELPFMNLSKRFKNTN